MKGLLARAAVLAFALMFGCTALKKGRCDHDSDCPSTSRCDLTPAGNGRCVVKLVPDASTDASSDADAGADVMDAVTVEAAAERPETSDASDVAPPCSLHSCAATVPICDDATKTCRACVADGGECAFLASTTPACVAGKCVECGGDSDCTVTTKPICDATMNTCRVCNVAAECVARGGGTPACTESGRCVECNTNTDCTVGTKPICNTFTNTCGACTADAQCPADPGVCMADGHCATTGEVIFVEFNASGCAGADGTSAKPYCAPNDGVAQLAAGRNVIVIRGSAGDRMTMSTTGLSPVVIGRKNATNVDGSVPATASTAITISSDTVLVRDLAVNLGSMPTSKGVLATGASTKVTLLRVTASLGTGLGVDAESGATLSMDECYVLANSTGGVLVNGAGYSIMNCVIAGNGGTTGYGVQFNAPTAGSQFWFDTVVNNPVAVTCDLNNAESLVSSIVTGPVVNCTLTDSLTSAPTFNGARAYHLTAHVACPTTPATFPDHDVDGDARVAPIDCGADQFVAP